MARDLFIYVDESGDFNFSPTGTSWYYITALSTFRPDYGIVRWHAIKHAAIRGGILLEELHASEDKQWVRDLVFPLIGDGAADLQVDAIAIDKAKTNPAIRDKAAFYRKMSLVLLEYTAEGRRRSFDRLFIFIDTVPVKRWRREIVGGLKRALATTLPGVPYHIEERTAAASTYSSWRTTAAGLCTSRGRNGNHGQGARLSPLSIPTSTSSERGRHATTSRSGVECRPKVPPR